MSRLALLVALIGCHASTGSPAAIDASTASPDGAVRLCAIGSAGCGAGSFCEAFSAGVAPMTGTCMMLPAACAATPTCTCMMANVICGAGIVCSGSGVDLGILCEGI